MQCQTIILINRLGSKVAKVNNRILLGMAFASLLVGAVLIGDWQAIIDDPCSLAPLNTSEPCDTENGSSFPGLSSNISIASGSIEDDCLNSTSNSSLYQQLVESCEALSNSSHQCFWNPKSRITGEFCNTCLPTCLSKQASLNIYQFSLGVVLICLSGPLGFVFTSAVTSDITSVESQVHYCTGIWCEY